MSENRQVGEAGGSECSWKNLGVVALTLEGIRMDEGSGGTIDKEGSGIRWDEGSGGIWSQVG